MNYKTTQYLQDKGFRVEFYDDLSAWWFTRSIKTKYFGNVEIVIESDWDNKNTYIKAQRNSIDGDDYIDFIQMKYSKKNLRKIIKLLKK